MCFLLVMLVAYYVKLLFGPEEAVFCSKDVTLQDCTPCPAHADCVQGKAECRKPYIREGDLCVENKRLMYMMHARRREVENIVMEKSAEMYVSNRGKYRVTLLKVRTMLVEETDDETWSMLGDYLRSPAYRGVLNVTDINYAVILSAKELSLSYIQQ